MEIAQISALSPNLALSIRVLWIFRRENAISRSLAYTRPPGLISFFLSERILLVQLQGQSRRVSTRRGEFTPTTALRPTAQQHETCLTQTGFDRHVS